MKTFIAWYSGNSLTVEGRTEFEAQSKAAILFGLRGSLQCRVIMRSPKYNAAGDQYKEMRS